MGKIVRHPERRKRRETALAQALYDSLFIDFTEVQQRYQDRIRGYLADCPFLEIYKRELNEQWQEYADRIALNPKKIVKLDPVALNIRIENFLKNQSKIAWMLYTIYILENDYNYKRYSVKTLQDFYEKNRLIPEEVAAYIMKTLPWYVKLERWINKIINRVNFHLQMLDYAFD